MSLLCSTIAIWTRPSRPASSQDCTSPDKSASARSVSSSTKRLLTSFLERFTAELKAVKIGDPSDEATRLGPLSSAPARDNLAKQVNNAVAHGATLHLGGKPIEGKGNFFEPTILTNVRRENPAYFEEFFGPVAQIYVVKNDDEVVELANDSHFGLAGVIFSKNIERAKKLASRIETGAVWINTFASTAPELPFGGVKRSGFGRELSELGLRSSSTRNWSWSSPNSFAAALFTQTEQLHFFDLFRRLHTTKETLCPLRQKLLQASSYSACSWPRQALQGPQTPRGWPNETSTQHSAEDCASIVGWPQQHRQGRDSRRAGWTRRYENPSTGYE